MPPDRSLSPSLSLTPTMLTVHTSQETNHWPPLGGFTGTDDQDVQKNITASDDEKKEEKTGACEEPVPPRFSSGYATLVMEVSLRDLQSQDREKHNTA